jgi:outer membrane protein assembly factor BamB
MRVKTPWMVVLAVALACSGLAADWPQFLGPDRNSTSSETGLLRSWPEGGPEVLWTVPVGRGYAGPVVKDGTVYLLDRDDDVGDTLRAFDLPSGKELWSFAYEAPGSAMFPGSRSVPTVDGDHVYIVGHNGDLHCISTRTHEPVWKANVWTDFGGTPPASGGGGRRGRGREPGSFPVWAITQNPLIYGDLLIVASQAPEAGVVAYDKRTGELKWKTAPLGFVSYASPAIVTVDGEDHVVMVTPSFNPFQQTGEHHLGSVVGMEPRTGKVLWTYDEWNCHITVPHPIDAGDNRVLIVGGYELGATMIQVEKKSDGTYAVKELFTTEDFGDQTKPPLFHDGHFYAQFGTNDRRDGLVCMGMDGTIKWKTKRSPDFNKGSMILADGLILATDGRKTLYLIEPDPSEFKPLASAELLGDAAASTGGRSRFGGSTQNWAPIALSDGKLLIRDQKQMKCIVVR